MRHLLDDLLDLSRGDSGRLSVSQQPVALLPLLEQVQEMAQSAQQRSIDLKLPESAELIANADPDRLQQVLLNLIENACKYSGPQTPIELALLPSEAELTIEVRDQGIGVPLEDQNRIFERFQRGSNAPAGEGSGLGLSVVRLLVEGMGGQVASQPARQRHFLHLRLLNLRKRVDARLPDCRLTVDSSQPGCAMHLHSEVSMRILHGLSTLALPPLLWQLWVRRKTCWCSAWCWRCFCW